MDGDERRPTERGRSERAAGGKDAYLVPEYSIRGSRAETHKQLGLHGSDLRLEPRPAGGDFPGAGLLVQAAGSAGDPLEVLYGIGDVGTLAGYAGLAERPVE